ncbi:MAG: hypothetical protein F4X97_09390 [Boseongicola sp. SB0662_bin_57]|nr:hypothetical protein [Boseongicola sp. SB0662_bin_57]
MTVHSPDHPFFLPQRTGENSGVDFLGLRQVNLDMMAEMIPSINNVTDYIRPFSLMSWVFWKFHDLCDESGVEEPSRDEIDRFRERIEVLFSWGAKLHETSGRVPGTGAVPPNASSNGRVPLAFKDWKRVQDSTSLIAALWYGPASKIVTGLGFLMPVPGYTGFFRTTGAGTRLAEALDAQLCQDQELYGRLLATLEAVTASEDDAVALWELWSPEEITEGEREAFASALHSTDEIGNTNTLLGRRSTTLALAIHHLTQCSSAVDAHETRSGMALSVSNDGKPYDPPEELVAARNNWLTLQIRQLQRLSMECLLSWCEGSILEDRVTETSAMAERFSAGWDGCEHGLDGTETLDAMIATLDEQASDINDFIQAVQEERLSDPFELIDSIQELFENSDPAYAQFSFAGILLCVTYAGVAGDDARLVRLGGLVVS